MIRSPLFSRPTGTSHSAGTQGTHRNRQACGVVDYLKSHDRLSGLLPTVTRLVALQRDCSALLPSMFDTCTIMQFEDGQLIIGTPSSAIASKLKHQLRKLQEGLLQRGWEVNAMRIKVQVGNGLEKSVTSKRLSLSDQAVSAFENLHQSLESTPRNADLLAALTSLLQRHHR